MVLHCVHEVNAGWNSPMDNEIKCLDICLGSVTKTCFIFISLKGFKISEGFKSRVSYVDI